MNLDKRNTMKKIIICLALAIGLSNCEIRVKEANAQTEDKIKESHHIELDSYGGVNWTKVTIDGMDYAVFVEGSGHTSPFVVNLTKDQLEIEHLKFVNRQ